MKVAELFETEAKTYGAEVDIANKGLTSLINDDWYPFADVIYGDFKCSRNSLTSLEGGPAVKVMGVYDVSENDLTSLEFSPQQTTKDFECGYNELTSLEGCPSKVGARFNCSNNKLTSLQGIHKLFKDGYIDGSFVAIENKITSHVLGLVLIPKLKRVSFGVDVGELSEVSKIINKHLQGDRDVIDCQQELIEAGLKAYAQL